MFEKIPEEKKEQITVSAETLSEEEFSDFVRSQPPESKIRDNQTFKYFSTRELNSLGSLLNKSEKFYSLVREGDTVVGLSSLEKNPHSKEDADIFWLKFLSIDPAFQGKGYASKLAEEIFRFAKSRGITLESSSYSDMGFEKLKPLLNRLSEEFGVPFIDTDSRI